MNRKESVCNEGQCLQLAFLGAKGTGKASLIHQVIGNGFVEEGAKENITECQNKTFNIPGLHDAVIMDTNDLHNFPPMKRVTIQRANIFVLVFALDNRESLEEIEEYYRDITEIKKESDDYHNHKIPIVVVGNKAEADMKEKMNSEEIEYKVSCEWGCKYIEVSAKTGKNIKELKETIIEEARLAYNVKQYKDRSKKKYSITNKLKSIF